MAAFAAFSAALLASFSAFFRALLEGPSAGLFSSMIGDDGGGADVVMFPMLVVMEVGEVISGRESKRVNKREGEKKRSHTQK